MAGYTRQDLANNISNGNVIDADDLDNEFNAIDAAFNNSTGHVHDGTAENGAPITVLGPVQDIVATATLLRPKTTNVVSLGTDALRYKDLFLEGNADVDGTVNVQGATTLQDSLAVTSNVTVGGNLTVTGSATIAGNLTFGDAATDTVSFAADVNSNLLPAADDTYDLGATGAEWRNLYIDGTANIDTAAVDTANVGTLSVSGNGTVAGSLTVTGGINATITGTASTANTLTTARTIALAGDVSGAANFDGSSNITITTVIADDSHNHTIANIDGLQTALDSNTSSISTNTSNIATNTTAIALKAPIANPTFTGSLTVNSTESIIVPVGTTAQRPTAATGMLRYNSTASQFEGYDGTEWGTIGGGGLVAQTATTTSTTQTAVASYAVADYVALELTVVADDSSDRTIAKLLVVHDGTTASATQYGEVNTGSTLATFDVDVSGGNVRLLATSSSATSTAYTTKAVTFDA